MTAGEDGVTEGGVNGEGGPHTTGVLPSPLEAIRYLDFMPEVTCDTPGCHAGATWCLDIHGCSIEFGCEAHTASWMNATETIIDGARYTLCAYCNQPFFDIDDYVTRRIV